jgi:hypothetical protein
MKQITPNERALPLYQAGLNAGTDVGLAFALTALTTERVREGEIQVAHTDPWSPIAARAAYAEASLHQVAMTVAAAFRRGSAS